MKRSRSTVRGWLDRDKKLEEDQRQDEMRFPGAYRARGVWRIPIASVLAFEAAERAGKFKQAPARRNDTVDLGAWRSAS